MKASRNNDTFTPVCLTLETQAEVDAIYAVLNYGPICDALGLDDEYKCLVPFRSQPNADENHRKLASMCNI